MRFTTLTITLLLCACSLLLPSAQGTKAYTPAQAGAAAVTPCDANAYVIDQDPAGMSVRSGPGKTFEVVGNLPTEVNGGVVVHITGSSGEWVRIDEAVEVGGDEDVVRFKGVGWVYGPLLGVDGVGWAETKLYAQASAKGKVLARIPAGGEGATVRGCKGKWVQVQFKQTKGWAAPGTLCSNPLTTCS